MEGQRAPGRYVVTRDELGPFLRGDSVGFLGNRVADPADPRATGIRGASQHVSVQASAELRRMLARKVGLYKAVVGKPAQDVWGTGWELDTDSAKLKEEAQGFDAKVRVWPTLVGLKAACREAHMVARRDNRSLLLLRLKAENPDTASAPGRVERILHTRVLPGDMVKEVILEDDPTNDRVGLPKAYVVWTKRGDDQSIATWHWERVLPFIERPDHDTNEFVGVSELESNEMSAHAMENIKFAATEAYYQRAVPLLVVTLDKDLHLKDDAPELKKLDEKLNQLQSNVVQKIRIQHATIEPLVGSENINDPTPFANLHREDVSAGSGIPKRELTGSEAGALQAAEWDNRRYFNGVVGPLQESFATGVLLDWYERLQRWGLLSAGEIRGITWYPYLQVDERERAPQQLVVASTLEKYQKLGLPVSKEVQTLVTIEGVDWDKPLPKPKQQEPAPAPAKATKPPVQEAPEVNEPAADANKPEDSTRLVPLAASARNAQDVLGITNSLKLARLEQRVQKVLQDALAKLRKDAETKLAAVYGEPVRLADRLLKRDARTPTDDEVATVLVTLTYDADTLAGVVEDVLIEAGELGLASSLKRLGRAGTTRFDDLPEAPVLRQYARRFTTEKAERMTRAVRDVVAQILAEGGGIREVRAALVRTFDGIENASAIARTESMRGWNTGVVASFRPAGVTQFRWVAYAGADQECLDRDGRMYSVHDATMVPPAHVNCRCTIIGLTEGMA